MLRTLILCAALVLAACGRHPDSVDSAAEAKALPTSTMSIGARGLPDAEIHSLARFTSLRILSFGRGRAVESAKITDAGLETLSKLSLPNLETLDLGYNDQITDDGLAHLTRMTSVRTLLLSACPQLTDRELTAPASMPNLEYLDLRGSKRITDAGLLTLTVCPSLKRLVLDGAEKITSAGVVELQERMPGTRITKDD